MSTGNPHTIMAAVDVAFRFTGDELRYGRRTTYRTRGRWVAAYLLRKLPHVSWSDIARLLGYADHTSALRGAAAAGRLCTSSPYYADLIRSLEVQLGLPVTGQESTTSPIGEEPTGGDS